MDASSLLGTGIGIGVGYRVLIPSLRKLVKKENRDFLVYPSLIVATLLMGYLIYSNSEINSKNLEEENQDEVRSSIEYDPIDLENLVN